MLRNRQRLADAASHRVLLVTMPFGGVDRPAIGISTIKSELQSRGIACDIRYLNFDFANQVGAATYQWFSDRASHMIFAGEWLFAEAFFGDELPPGDEYIAHLRNVRGVDEVTVRTILAMRELVQPFLQHCMDAIDWPSYSIVGFSSTFEQNAASLALSHAIKTRWPDLTIVMGGANCEGSMGLALHRHFPFLDYVFTGPSDLSFPDLVERLQAKCEFADIPGMVFRRDGESVSTGPARGPRDLDRLPMPDYDDYFAQLEATTIRSELPIRLQMETSRGCWWGMKHHCTFCGMYAEQMHFGSKSPRRVLDEIEYLVSRYGITGIDAVDAIMDMRYFREVLPALRDKDLQLELFYELKANLSRDQVRLLADAGVKFIQPGIESFHPKILKLMRKGTSPLQNVQLLKWCKQFGVEPTWNLLYGFPGESKHDYEELVAFTSKLVHLPAPRGCGQLRMDRFSPHFDDAEAFGFTNVRPLRAYRFIYPLAEAEVAEIAYFFDYDYADGRDPKNYAAPLESLVRRWQGLATRGVSLTMDKRGDGSLFIRDTRGPFPQELQLKGWQAHAYLMCDRALTVGAVEDGLREGTHSWSPADLKAFLDSLVERDLMIEDDDKYLSLAVESSVAAADHGTSEAREAA